MSVEVKEEYKGWDLVVMLGLKTIKSAQKVGFEYVDSHHEPEINVKVRTEMDCLGKEVYKQLHIYKKNI